MRLAAFAQVLPAVGNGLLALGPLEHRRHRRPVPRRAARRPETGTDGLDGGHRLPVATRREHRRRCSARVRRRKAHQWDQAPRRCGHLGLLLVVLVSLRPARKSATGGRRVGAGCWSGCGRAMPSVAVVFVFTQGGYAGCLVHWARRVLRVAIEIVRKLLTSKVSRSCRGWDGTHIELADALPAAGPRLRTAPRKPRGHGQVDHDRTDYDPRTGTRTRTTPLDAARPLTPSQTRSQCGSASSRRPAANPASRSVASVRPARAVPALPAATA